METERVRRHGEGHPTRLLFPTDRSDVRLTWHAELDRFVLTLWHDDLCVGSAPLTVRNAAEMAAFVVNRLAERDPRPPPTSPPRAGALERALTQARGAIAGRRNAWRRQGQA